MKEVRELASVLELAIPAADTAVVSLAVTGVGAELRELTEHVPDIRYASVGGQEERLAARTAVKDLVLSLRRIDLAVAAGHLDEAMAEYENFSMLATFDVPVALKRPNRGRCSTPTSTSRTTRRSDGCSTRQASSRSDHLPDAGGATHTSLCRMRSINARGSNLRAPGGISSDCAGCGSSRMFSTTIIVPSPVLICKGNLRSRSTQPTKLMLEAATIR